MSIKPNYNKGSFELSGNKFLDNLKNHRILVRQGLANEGPIVRNYDWPSPYPKPMKHQISTSDFMTLHPRGFVLNDMGTGKTFVMHWTLDYLMQQKEVDKVLIICPLSILRTEHLRQIKESFPHLKAVSLHASSKSRRLKALNTDADVYLINFDGIKVLYDDLMTRKDINAVLIDEVAELKNSRTKLFKAIDKFAGYESDKKVVWGLTGTPMPNSPTDCYALAMLINPKALPQKMNYRTNKKGPIRFTDFRYKVCIKSANGFSWVPKSGWEETCYNVLQPSIRFERTECFDLPKLTKNFLDIPYSAEQKKAYLDLKNLCMATLDSGESLTVATENAKVRKFMQISCGGIYTAKDLMTPIPATPMFTELMRLIDNELGSERHILVFCAFRLLTDYIADKLSRRYQPKHVASITSQTKTETREEVFHKFCHGDKKIIVATPGCMAHGLNLHHKCCHIVWLSPPSFKDYDQACARVVRPGQKWPMTFSHFQSSYADKVAYKRLLTKAHNQRILQDILAHKGV